MSSTPKSVGRKGARQLFPNRSFDQNNDNNNSYLMSMSAPFVVNLQNEIGSQLDVAKDCISDIDNAIVPIFHEDRSTTNNITENNANGIIMPPPLHLQKHEIFNLYRDKRLMADHFNESAASSILNLSVDSMLDSPMYKERHLKLADAEKGLEVFGRQLAREQNINWKEYWSFLGSFVDIGSEAGLNMLENHLKENKETREGVECQPSGKTMSHNLSVSSLCGALDKLNFRESRSLTNLRNGNNNNYNLYDCSPLPLNNGPIQSPNAFSAYLCAEKACQVYAKRMTKIIVQNLNSVISINDSLKSELKRLKSLVWSYSEDIRFFAVNFQSTHSRFANLIVAYLKFENESELIQIRDLLTQIHQTTQRLIDTVNDIYSPRSESATSNLQLDCLLKFLLHYLSDAG